MAAIQTWIVKQSNTDQPIEIRASEVVLEGKDGEWTDFRDGSGLVRRIRTGKIIEIQRKAD